MTSFAAGWEASQYKDHILTLLFVKYVSDKQTADPDSLIDVPKGGSFDDMVDGYREMIEGWKRQ